MGRQTGLLDTVIAPVTFVAVNAWAGVRPAAYTALATALVTIGYRLVRHTSPRHAVSGILATGLAIVLALRSGEARDYFLPGIVIGVFTAAMILVSIGLRRPFVAWVSWATRQWPLEWYWHPRVRPAYTVTSWIWFGFFAIRSTVQWWLYSTGQTTRLGLVRIATGWPGLVALAAVTYLIGRRRLERLEGPSVEQFIDDHSPPWTPQPQGF